MITRKTLEGLWVHSVQWDLFEQFLGDREGVEPTPDVIREAALFGLDVQGGRDAGLFQLPDGPIVFKDGHRVNYLNGQIHCEDGPAIVWPDGHQEWWVHDERHCEDGPAILRPNGDREWWVNGQKDRADGPAIERANGRKEWWVNGERIKIEGADYSKEWWFHGKPHRENPPAVMMEEQ